MKPLVLAYLLAATLSAFPTGAGADEWTASGPVKIEADSLSHSENTGTYDAAGNVRIQWDAATLTSEKASLDQGKRRAVAEGRVKLVRQGDVLESDRLDIDFATQRGEVTNGDLFVRKSNLHVRGKKIAKLGEDEYRLEQGSFTTCDGDDPSWRFSASDLDVTLEGMAVGRNALFYVGKIPVFYTPYILFPVKVERQSGFLFPRIGSSTKKGFYLDQPYYWALSPSQDLTLDLDIQTRRGVGLGADYRFIRSEGNDGEIRGYGIYDTSQSRFRGDVELKQRETLLPGLDAKADVNLVSDRDFYRDFSVATGIYNRQLLDSSLSLTKRWEDASLAGELRYVQDIEAANNRLTLQRLPTVNYTLLGRRFGHLPAYVSLDSSLTNFYREEGQTGQRLDVRPVVTVMMPIPGGAASAWAGYRQRLYRATDDAVGGGGRGSGIADAGAALATWIERTYDKPVGNFQRFKHSVIPEVGYRLVERKDQESLPFFDFNDRVLGQSLVTWAVSNFITGKTTDAAGGAEYRELVWLKLSQSYTLRGERRDLLTLADQARPFSDVRIEARVNPLKRLSLFTDNRFDTYHARFSTASLSGDLKDDDGNLAGVGYHMSRGVVEYLEGRLGLSLVKPFVFNYTGRYSFDRGAFLEAVYAVEYKRQCWSLTFSFRDRPDNREFLVSFALAGIGPVGPVRAF